MKPAVKIFATVPRKNIRNFRNRRNKFDRISLQKMGFSLAARPLLQADCTFFWRYFPPLIVHPYLCEFDTKEKNKGGVINPH
jgi:hypothetical protein